MQSKEPRSAREDRKMAIAFAVLLLVGVIVVVLAIMLPA
jgi:hypothetical protein